MVAGGAQGQSTDSAAAGSSSASGETKDQEISTSDEVPAFQSRVDLVVVPVVVRDKNGQAIGTLKREDFQVLDDGKAQPISTFSVETSGTDQPESGNPAISQELKNTVLGVAPSHFFAYLFDDVHLNVGDLMQVRAAAKKYLASADGAGQRMAVFTTSGDVSMDFTNDKTRLSQTIDRIYPRSGATRAVTQCPYMNYHLAKTIVNESAGGSLTPGWDGATDDAWNCRYQRAQRLQAEARRVAFEAALEAEQQGDADVHTALMAIKGAIRRLEAMPGRRTLILVSPGFLTGDDHLDQNNAAALATGSNIIINALDARGLYTDSRGADRSGPGTAQAALAEDSINRQGLMLQGAVMAQLADDTGGQLFQGNDLLGGFNRLASPPRYVYSLAFRPQSLKHDGHYHHLKVVVAHKGGWAVQARHGYYESRGAGEPGELVTEELQHAFFSLEEMHNLPITLKTQSVKPNNSSIELLVTTHMDAKTIRFQRVDNRNQDELTVVCGLFDLNGNYVQAKKQELALHLSDETLKQLTDGINVKTNFEVKPGAYIVRVVVRDSGWRKLSAVNGSVVVQ